MKIRLLPKEDKKQVIHNGYGKEIPPCLVHVIIWFVQQGSTAKEANRFFMFYHFRNWKNNRGGCIKDWKMNAWDWVWSGR